MLTEKGVVVEYRLDRYHGRATRAEVTLDNRRLVVLLGELAAVAQTLLWPGRRVRVRGSLDGEVLMAAELRILGTPRGEVFVGGHPGLRAATQAAGAPICPPEPRHGVTGAARGPSGSIAASSPGRRMASLGWRPASPWAVTRPQRLAPSPTHQVLATRLPGGPLLRR